MLVYQRMTGWWCNNHLEKWWSSSMGKMTSHILWKIKKCLKPPTSLWYAGDKLARSWDTPARFLGVELGMTKGSVQVYSSSRQLMEKKNIDEIMVNGYLKKHCLKIWYCKIPWITIPCSNTSTSLSSIHWLNPCFLIVKSPFWLVKSYWNDEIFHNIPTFWSFHPHKYPAFPYRKTQREQCEHIPTATPSHPRAATPEHTDLCHALAPVATSCVLQRCAYLTAAKGELSPR